MDPNDASTWVAAGLVALLVYFFVRELRDHLQRDYRIGRRAVKLWEQGRFSEALPLAERALKLHEQRLDVGEEELIKFVDLLADLNFRLRRWERAEPLCQRSVGLAERVWGVDHLMAAERLCVLGQVQHNRGDDPTALASLERARGILATKLGLEHHATQDLVRLVEKVQAARAGEPTEPGSPA